MNIKTLNNLQLKRYVTQIVKFIKRYGDKRITRTAIEKINDVSTSQSITLNKDGHYALCALEGNKLVGFLMVVDYGREESIIVIHKHYRNQDLAQRMVQQTIDTLTKLYGRVAIDNIPSLKVCLSNGMVAFDLFKGPTGKPTLWLGGGNWSKEDVLS